MSISNQLSENPGLIVLINNPTEEDLLKVIYSKNTMDSIIMDLPDEYITPRVATIALCLTKKWSEESLNTWFDKFFPLTSSEDQLKIFKAIHSNLPSSKWTGKDIPLFIKLFSQNPHPSDELIDFYLSVCIFWGYLGIEDNHCNAVNRYRIIDSALTKNLKGKLNDAQQRQVIDTFKDTVNTDTLYYIPSNTGNLPLVYKDWECFITNKIIYKEGKSRIAVYEKKMEDYKKYEEAPIKDAIENKHWWQNIL